MAFDACFAGEEYTAKLNVACISTGMSNKAMMLGGISNWPRSH
jgi:hypothetical protein